MEAVESTGVKLKRLLKVLARRDGSQTALDHLLEAVDLIANYPEPHDLLGQLYQKSGQRDEAAREFAVFERISKQTPHKKQ
jgi:Flp pilus assembly protein TadD